MILHNLFPTGVAVFENNDINLQEHEDLLNLSYSKHKFYDMHVTGNKYVLNSIAPSIKKFIDASVQQYTKAVLGTNNRLKITQSWCSKHDNIPQVMEPHIHQNSIISGAYYVKADERSSSFQVFKDNVYNTKYITWDTDEELVQNCPYMWDWVTFPVHTGRLLLFPSWLRHAVRGDTSEGVRCSLAFNTWFEGEFGSVEDLTRL